MRKSPLLLLFSLIVSQCACQYLFANESKWGPSGAPASNYFVGDTETGFFTFKIDESIQMRSFFVGNNVSSVKFFDMKGDQIAQISPGEQIRMIVAQEPYTIIAYDCNDFKAISYVLQTNILNSDEIVYSFNNKQTPLSMDSTTSLIFVTHIQGSNSNVLIRKKISGNLIKLLKYSSTESNPSSYTTLQTDFFSLVPTQYCMASNDGLKIYHTCSDGKITIVDTVQVNSAIEKEYKTAPFIAKSIVSENGLLYSVLVDISGTSLMSKACVAPNTASSVLNFDCKATGGVGEDLSTFTVPNFEAVIVLFTNPTINVLNVLDIEIFSKDMTSILISRMSILTSQDPRQSYNPFGFLSVKNGNLTEKIFGGVFVQARGSGSILQMVSIMKHFDYTNDKDFTRCRTWGAPVPACTSCHPFYYYSKDLPTKCLLKTEIPVGYGVDPFSFEVNKCFGCDYCLDDWTCSQTRRRKLLEVMEVIYDYQSNRVIISFKEDYSESNMKELQFNTVIDQPGVYCIGCNMISLKNVRLSGNKLAIYFSNNESVIDKLVVFKPLKTKVEFINIGQQKEKQELGDNFLIDPEDIVIPKLTYFATDYMLLTKGAIILFAIFCKNWHILILKGLFYKRSLKSSIHFHSVLSTIGLLYAIDGPPNGVSDTFTGVFASYGFVGLLLKKTYSDSKDYMCKLPRHLKERGLNCNMIDNYWWNIVGFLILLAAFALFEMMRCLCPVKDKGDGLKNHTSSMKSYIKHLFTVLRKDAFNFKYVIAFVYGSSIECLAYCFINIGFMYKGSTVTASLILSIVMLIIYLLIIASLLCVTCDKKQRQTSESGATVKTASRFIRKLDAWTEDICFRYKTDEKWGYQLSFIETINSILFPLVTVVFIKTKTGQPVAIMIYQTAMIILLLCTKSKRPSEVTVSIIASHSLIILYCFFVAISFGVSSSRTRYELFGVLLCMLLFFYIVINILVSVFHIAVHFFVNGLMGVKTRGEPSAVAPRSQGRSAPRESELNNDPLDFDRKDNPYKLRRGDTLEKLEKQKMMTEGDQL